MTPNLTDLEPSKIGEVVDLISNAMNPDEGKWAEKTISRHYEMQSSSIDDGRLYYVVVEGEQIVGIAGLHHYEWGPPQNIWLGWFAVKPGLQNSGIGTAMLGSVESRAAKLGYQKMLIETYSSPDFESARRFYTKRGYIPSGLISDYISDGVDMIVYGKTIKDS